MVDSLTYLFYFVVVGMLCGIIWSLKYIVRIERRIENMEGSIDRLLGRMEKEIEKENLNRLYIIGEKEQYNAIIEKNYIVRFCSKNFIDITNKIVKQIDNLALK